MNLNANSAILLWNLSEILKVLVSFATGGIIPMPAMAHRALPSHPFAEEEKPTGDGGGGGGCSWPADR